MECLRTFNFAAGAQTNFSGTNLATWGTASNTFFQIETPIGGSSFNVEGFKNINVWGIDMVGRVASIIQGTGNHAIVEDWNFAVRVYGQNSIIGGTITPSPNYFVIQDLSINPTFILSKYSPSIKFESPITSVTKIELVALQVSGYGAENTTLINMGWGANFVVYYNFEGE